ncbi:(2Fe-2S)-binding protein [bacterium AH-315-K03]|nr:(2Fe-2S)-binding protein [bacterium AH-315-K03]
MYVCVCNAITDDHIQQAVENGATHFRQVCKELGLASQCGKCGILARSVFNDSLQRTMDEEPLFYAAS